MRHARGKTIGELDNVLITNLVMNTAQGHFNEVSMQGTKVGQRLVFGGVTAAMVIGLASQDTAEQAIAELGLDKMRFRVPVLHGDTLFAYTEVISVQPALDQPHAGEVHFRHWGVNQRDEVVFEGERRTLIRRRPPDAG